MPSLSSFLTATPPAHQEFTLSLTKPILNTTAPSFLPLDVKFAYTWDWALNMGNASILSVGGTTVPKTDESMFPMGLATSLSFMRSDHFEITIDNGKGEQVYAYRVILALDKETATKKSAAMMVGKDGDSIIASENWVVNEA